jgi:aminoglycoside phosphotransferase (APT) family kinase protein
MVQAARWAGRFHRVNEDRIPALGFLTRYDATYYLGWVRRTSEFAGARRQEFPWLEALASRSPEAMELLLAARPTVVHGEYYPTNVLYRDGDISPVDWESAAVGPGEIDLAALTEGWGAGVVRECEQGYLGARWPEGAPDNWSAIASAARLFNNFRWLGQREEWTVSGTSTWRFEALRTAGRELNLLR